ncbi:MAG: polysaccharide deacetylase family protein [Chitinophagaceae bacterium]|jgi:peptidoglycan/xylan/chitin deacetylase (PgdA/CDA1 family)
MQIKVFLFHRVAPLRDAMWDPMDPVLFERVIKSLNKSHHCIRFEDFFRDRKNFENASKPLCAMVFDDGYKDFIEYALPVLSKYNVPSSMYVVSSCVESQLPPWTYQLDYCFNHSGKLSFDLETSLLPENLKNTNWNSAQERINFGKTLKPFLKKIPDQNRRHITAQIIASADDVKIPDNLLMTWKEINQIIAEGVEVGSHTHTHPLLAKIESEAIIKEELNESFRLIKQNCNIEPYTISYPIGSYNASVMKLSQEAGYKIGLAVDQKFYSTESDDIFSIPRVELYNENWIKTSLRMSGVYTSIKKLIS